jgi:ribosome-associated protein
LQKNAGLAPVPALRLPEPGPGRNRIFCGWTRESGILRPMPPTLEITPDWAIPDDELVERFVRSSGPGGQNVNKVSTAVELRFDVRASPGIPEAVRERILARRDRRLTDEGVLVISAQRFRTQDRNREDARARLAAILREATVVAKKRVATRPTKGSKERRLTGKKERAGVKKLRTARWDSE